MCIRDRMIIKAAKRIFNSDKICCSYYDFYFGVTFSEHTVLQRFIDRAIGQWRRRLDQVVPQQGEQIEHYVKLQHVSYFRQ